LAAGALALQTFIKNAEYVEMVVGVAFGVIPSILGLGAAGLLASGISNTAKEVRSSLSLLKTVGPGLLYGTAMAGKGLNIGRKAVAEWAKQRNHPAWLVVGNVLTPYQWIKSKWKKNNQDTQGKQEEQDRSGSGNPPTPPDIKSDKKEEQAKINGMPIDEYIKKKQKA